MSEIECPRCTETFHKMFDDERFRSGRFTEELPDGTIEVYTQLCEDCHREVVRNP